MVDEYILKGQRNTLYIITNLLIMMINFYYQKSHFYIRDFILNIFYT